MMHSVQALYCNWDCHWDCLRILGLFKPDYRPFATWDTQKWKFKVQFPIKNGFWRDSCAQIGNTEPSCSLIHPYNQLLRSFLFHARSMNNPLEHVFKPIFLLSLSSIMELTPWRTKVGKKNECAITQHFEVMEHEQSAKSCLKKCKFTVKKCLVKIRQKGCFGA